MLTPLADALYREAMESYDSRYELSKQVAADQDDRTKALDVLFARRSQLNAWYGVMQGEVVLGKKK